MTSFSKSLAAALLAGTAVTAHAAPNTILFSSGVLPNGAPLRPGQAPAGTLNVRGGVTQVQTSDGEVFSFVGDATFDADRPVVSITDGRVTVSGGRDGAAAFSVGSDIATSVNGQNAAASFTVNSGAITGGRVLAGTVSVSAGGVTRSFDLGQAFAAAVGQPPRAIATPGVAPIRAAAFVPSITPPDQGVSGDVETATSINLGVVPGTSPLATFEAVAALRGALGGFRFPATTSAFFDVNLASVRAGQALGSFRSDTAASLTAAYLAALRAGTPPSTASTNAAYQAALFSYFRADGLPAGTPATTRDLLNSYNAIIAAGGVPANFSAAATAASLSALQRYLAAGGDRAAYTATTSALIAAYDRAYAALGAGNGAAADVATIEAARALQAALGSNTNFSVASAASLLSAYFASLGTGAVQTGGLSAAQLQALLAYYNAASAGLTIDSNQAVAIATYQNFLAGGGSFGAPAATPLEIARNVARVVEVRRQGQAAAFLDLRDAEGLTNALLYLVRNGVPEGLSTAERERVDAALAFFGSTGRPGAGNGGIFETPGVATLATGSPLGATTASSLTTGNYVVAGFGSTFGGALTGTSTGNVVFVNGLPTDLRLATTSSDFVVQQPGSILVAGRAQDGWLIGRFAPSSRHTTGRDFALAPVFTGLLPTSGTATYALTAWTTPQYGDQRLVTAASMTGNAVLNFTPGAVSIIPNVTISATDPLNTFTYTIAGSTLTTNNTTLCPTATACRVSTPLLLGGTAGQTVVGGWSITSGVVQSGTLLGGAWVFSGSLVTTAPPVTPVARIMVQTGVTSTLTTGNYVGAYGFSGGTRSFGPQQVVFDSLGQPRSSGITFEIPATATGTQHAKADNWLMARFVRSTGQHDNDIVVMRPPTVAIPTTGRAEFQFFSNLDILSRSTLAYMSTLLEGRAAITFGQAPRVGIDAVLRLVQTTGTVDTYRIGSLGAFTSPNESATYTASSNSLLAGGSRFTLTGPECGSLCFADFSFALGGPNADLFGGTFTAYGEGLSRALFIGTAIATKVATGTTTAPTGTAGRVAAAAPPTAAPTSATYAGGGFGDAGPIAVATDAAGVATRFGNTTIGTARLVDGRSTPAWIIGRYADGTVSQTFGGAVSTQTYGPNTGVHFGYATALPSAIPATGSATYGIAAFTTPTAFDGSAVSGATLTGGFAIAFGTAPKFGAAGILTLNNNGAQSYSWSTTGGLAAPSLAMFANGTTLFPSGFVPVTTTDGRCATNCRISFNLATGGSASDVLAGSYAIGSLSASGNAFGSFLGGALVATTATAVGTTPSAPPATGLAVGAGTQIVKSYGAFPGTTTNAIVTADSAGQVASYSDASTAVGRGSNTDREFGSVAGVIGWTRWAGGTTTGAPSNRSDLVKTISDTGGASFVYGTPATALPTSGTASYDMIGRTAVVVNDGALPLASVTSAALAVNFATMRAGFEATLNSSGQAYTLASTGGSGNPSMPIANNQFSNTGGSTIVGNGCTGSNCGARIEGFLAGVGASHAGVSFTFTGGVGAGAPQLNGVVAFAKRP